VRRWKRDFGRHPVGTGPYRLACQAKIKGQDGVIRLRIAGDEI